MLDFRPKKPQNGVRFSLDRAEQVRMAGQADRSRRRRWHTAFIVVIIGIIIWLGYDFLKSAGSTPTQAKRLEQEAVAPPMPRPSLEGLPAMPAGSEIAAHAAAVVADVASGTPPVFADDADPALLAWARGVAVHDQATPPLPQVVEAKDLILRHLRIGSPVMVSGQLVDSAAAPLADGGEGWQRQVVMLEPDRYCLLLSPASAAALPVGDQLQAVGRFVGFAHLPSSQAASADPAAAKPFVEVPFIIARRAGPLAKPDDSQVPFWRAEGMFTVPADVYDNVDDERLILETRPYYYAIGQVSREQSTPGVFAEAGNGNLQANDIHQKPSDFRGKPFTVHGKVFNAWVDPLVSRDQPFGVMRVVRVIFWSEDLSPLTMMVAGKPTVVTKLVTRVYEIAAITDQEPPAPGTRITATGRFLRLRAMEVKPDPQREAAAAFARQSDRSYTFFFVTGAWIESPPDAPNYVWTGWHWLLLAGVLAFSGWMVWLVRHRSALDGQVQDSVRKLRSVRQRRKPGATPEPPDSRSAGPE